MANSLGFVRAVLVRDGISNMYSSQITPHPDFTIVIFHKSISTTLKTSEYKKKTKVTFPIIKFAYKSSSIPPHGEN